jgi:hypothetical protein
MMERQGRRTAVLAAIMLVGLACGCGVHAQDLGALLVPVAYTHAAPTETVDLGPCSGVARKTLLQWSYGTSFGGGPDLDKPLVTDRPDFTEASSTVGRGVVQLEGGYTYISDHDGQHTTHLHSVGEPLLRVGIGADWLELRIAVNYLHETRRGDGWCVSDAGASDLYLGVKLGLTPQEGILPEMAVAPQLLLPTGDPPFLRNEVVIPGSGEPASARRLAAGVNWLYGWELNEQFFLGASTQFVRTDDEVTKQAFTLFGQSCVLHWSLTEQFDVYGEWFALLPIGADSVLPEQYLSLGMIYYVTEDFQLDARCGIGLNDAADNCFLGVGGAVRFH